MDKDISNVYLIKFGILATAQYYNFVSWLMRYSWHITLNQFQVYKIVIWYLYVLQSDHGS